MKIDINVLSDGQKEKIKEERKIGFASKLGVAFIGALLLLNGVLYFLQGVLGIEYQAAQKSSSRSFAGSMAKEGRLEKVFQETNGQIAALAKISSTVPNWARVLVRISEICPSDVRIKQFSAEGGQIKISGFSKTREAFLDFQDKLKNEGFQFPIDISNLVASKDFDFDLEPNIPEDYLIRK
ncbi:MAG: PilN domain-containing protein [Candidatus Moraniibacteriota bacterium]